MDFMEKYRRSNEHRRWARGRLFPRNPDTGLPYSRDIALTPRNIWRILKWLAHTDVVQILFQPFTIMYRLIMKIFKRREENRLFYDAEYDTWFREGRDVSERIRRHCPPPIKEEEPTYNMTPHKFE